MTPEQAKQAVAEIEKAHENAYFEDIGALVAALPPGFLADCVEVAMAAGKLNAAERAWDKAAKGQGSRGGSPLEMFEEELNQSRRELKAALARVRAHLEME